MAEEKEYDTFWMHENPFIRPAVPYLANLATTTSTIKLDAGRVSTVMRNPLLTASTFATLNEFSNGRTILGVGLGGFPWLPKIGVNVFPVEETKPLHRLREFVTVTRDVAEGNQFL